MRIDRILIVGLGSIGARHLRLARAVVPDADIRVLRRADGPLPDNASGCFAELAQAIQFKPQIAVIATPASLHLSVAQALAEVGAHLLVEKPLASSQEGVNRLIETCRAGAQVLLVGYNLRFLSSLQRFREAVHKGVVGEVLSVRCEVGQHLADWRPGTGYRNTASAKRELGGGALLELSHELDYLRWIFGEVDWVSACLRKQSTLEIDVEDTAHLLLGFGRNGKRGLVASANLDFIRHDPTRNCTAIGELGTLCWDGIQGTVRQYAPASSEWTELFRRSPARDESYLAEWMHLLACVDGSEMPAVSGEDGLRVLEIVAAARIASERAMQVPVAAGAQGREVVA